MFATIIGVGSTAALLLGANPALAEGEDPCTAESFKFAQVEAACKAGGRKAAKTLMKKAVAKAKAAGETMNCKSCHSSMKTFALTDDAVSGLEGWL
ncbi:MAG: hypothetical protein AB1Z98_09725 [Nannocystaceae bacterium]